MKYFMTYLFQFLKRFVRVFPGDEPPTSGIRCQRMLIDSLKWKRFRWVSIGQSFVYFSWYAAALGERLV